MSNNAGDICLVKQVGHHHGIRATANGKNHSPLIGYQVVLFCKFPESL
jgi:hypothetical protein